MDHRASVRCLCLGIGVAADILLEPDAVDERCRIARQRNAFIDELRALGCPTAVNGPEGEFRHPGNADLRFDGFDAHDLLNALQPHLAASTGAACTSGFTEPSHVLRAIGLTDYQAGSSIRFSFGRFTTDDEIENAALLCRKIT